MLNSVSGIMESECPQNERIYSKFFNTRRFTDPIIPKRGKNIFDVQVKNSQRNDDIYVLPDELLDDNAQQEENCVLCTYCIQAPVPALKYCQICDASLCVLHLNVHSKSPEHVLIKPMRSLGKSGNIKCTKHHEILKFHCFEDDTRLCVACYVEGNHKGHKIEMLDYASQRKNKDLKGVLENLISQQNETEKRVHLLQQQTIDVEEKAVERSERVSALFTNIRRQLHDLETTILSELSKEQEKVSLYLKFLIKQLELKQDELSKSIRQIEELCNMKIPLTALTMIGQKTVDFWDPKERYSMVSDVDDFDEGLITATLQRSLDKIMAVVKWEQGTSDILLDVNTAANNVYLSGDKKTVSWTKINQCRQKSLIRFKGHQVLSTGSFSSGRHYWEVEASESGKWIIGMCYPSVDRKGDQSPIGNNNKSWGLSRLDKYKVVHDNKEKRIMNVDPCHRIGIYLDYDAGQLSFYELGDTIRHLHTFTATFTEPLHAVFWVSYGWVRIKS